MKILCFLFLLIGGNAFGQDLAAAQRRADLRLNTMKTELQLTNEQIPTIKQLIDNTEKECETIAFDPALSQHEIDIQVQQKRNAETNALKDILTPEQFGTYSASPAPAKANINTSRSSIKQNREK